MNMKKIGETVKSRRKVLKLSQTDLAEIADISTVTVSALENGIANITINNLYEILDILGLEIKIDIKQR